MEHYTLYNPKKIDSHILSYLNKTLNILNCKKVASYKSKERKELPNVYNANLVLLYYNSNAHSN